MSFQEESRLQKKLSALQTKQLETELSIQAQPDRRADLEKDNDNVLKQIEELKAELNESPKKKITKQIQSSDILSLVEKELLHGLVRENQLKIENEELLAKLRMQDVNTKIAQIQNTRLLEQLRLRDELIEKARGQLNGEEPLQDSRILSVDEIMRKNAQVLPPIQI